jgi:ABC-type transport system involved in multi-copper enzyme maturation permease subunit
MKTLWLTQIAAILRLELRKTFFSRRGLWVYLLALAPLAIFGGHSLIQLIKIRRPCDFGEDTNIFAGIFQTLDLRIVIFFGCLGIFMNLFRGEVLDRSLHYYFLAPIRREVLVVGKYLAGIIAALAIFTTSTVLQWTALYAHFPAAMVGSYLRDGNGWSHLAAYAGTTALGCVGYGSVFLLTGALFRNPIFPAAGMLIWESINNFMPPFLQKFSVIYYLKSLCPIEAPPGVGPPFSLLIVNADPIAPGLAISGILLFTLLVVVIAALQVRRMEINYGTD